MKELHRNRGRRRNVVFGYNSTGNRLQRLEEKQEEVYSVTPFSYPVTANEKQALTTVELQRWMKVDDAAFEGVSWKPEGGRCSEHEMSVVVVVDDAARTKVLVDDGGSSRWMMQRGKVRMSVSMVKAAMKEMRRSVTYMPRSGDGAPWGMTLILGNGIGPLVTNAVEQVMEAMHVPLYFEKYEVHRDMRRVSEEVDSEEQGLLEEWFEDSVKWGSKKQKTCL